MLRGGARSGVIRFANAIENAPRRGFEPDGFSVAGAVLRLVAEERVFQRNVVVGRIQPHGFAKLFARQIGFPNLEIGVGEVFPDIRAMRREPDGFGETGDGTVVILLAERTVRAGEQVVGRFFYWFFYSVFYFILLFLMMFLMISTNK